MNANDGLEAGQQFELHFDDDVFRMSDKEIGQLRSDIQGRLEALGLPSWIGANGGSKERIRAIHAEQRNEVLTKELGTLRGRIDSLLNDFADGSEVRPESIRPELVPVRADDHTGHLFRLATLLWSVPVSKGYGRRMRYLVRDKSNGKLIGIFGLTDPVFNLRARDEWIGWTVEPRRQGLVHVMDAYVVGAVPPYSALLGGKLVASLMASAEVGEAFSSRYSQTAGIISGRRKNARLVLITVTSALGRSSLYNRLRLTERTEKRSRNLVNLLRIGETSGYGHFHLSEPIFRRLRDFVRAEGHAYADEHSFGKGPNWRIRVSRVGLTKLGLDPDLIKHGIAREVYAMPLATNCREFLCGQAEEALIDRPAAAEIARAALDRWVLPRAQRCPEFENFRREDLRRLFSRS